MSEEIEKNEEIAIIEKAPQVFEKAPAILLANQIQETESIRSRKQTLSQLAK